MYQKLDLNKLKSKSLTGLETVKNLNLTRQAELKALKEEGGESWTEALQEELDYLVAKLPELEELIAEKKSAAGKKGAAPAKEEVYEPSVGTEKMVHLSIVRGRRFNPFTGKEESEPFVQLFTFSEWQLFKKSFKNLGYTILKVLHDPYGDAAELVANK